MDENRVIGANGGLPWRLPADLRRFRRITMGHPILIGRKTYESIGRPLPGRQNIVVTRDPAYRAEGCTVVNSVEDALLAGEDSDELFVTGGAVFFAQLIECADRMYLTHIYHAFEGDTFFPEFDPDEWRETERSDHEPDEKNPYRYSFVVLKRG